MLPVCAPWLLSSPTFSPVCPLKRNPFLSEETLMTRLPSGEYRDTVDEVRVLPAQVRSVGGANKRGRRQGVSLLESI